MEITEETIEDAHWRTGLSRARLRELSAVVPAPLSESEAAQLDLSHAVITAFTL